MASRKRIRKNMFPTSRPRNISEKKWKAIWDWLNEKGRGPKRVTLEDLLQIPGIGPRTIEKLQAIEPDDPCRQRDEVQRGIKNILRRRREENLHPGRTLH